MLSWGLSVHTIFPFLPLISLFSPLSLSLSFLHNVKIMREMQMQDFREMLIPVSSALFDSFGKNSVLQMLQNFEDD